MSETATWDFILNNEIEKINKNLNIGEENKDKNNKENKEIKGGGYNDLDINQNNIGGSIIKIDNVNNLNNSIKEIFENKNNECSHALDIKKNDSCVGNKFYEKIINDSNIKNGGVGNDNITYNILSTIKDRFKCDDERCVLTKIRDNPNFSKFINIHQIDDMIKRYFKPEGPSETFNFLSNHNIDNVLNQFFHKYNDPKNKFYNIKFQMRDFAENNTELTEINFYQKINDENYKTFAVVFNTDYSNGIGIHWFCIFIDARDDDKIDIEYFNSSGRNPLKEIEVFLVGLEKDLKNQFKGRRKVNYKIVSNSRFQDDNHSCGVWSLSYIWLRLEGIPTAWFNPSNIDDSTMHLLRKYFFNTDNKKIKII